jgi:chemotaxis protein MotB
VSTPADIEEEDDAPSAPFWMTTYSDMVTLLLTFFVLIVSMSEIEIRKFEEALSFFQGRPSLLTHDALIRPTTPQLASAFRTKEQAERYEALLEYLEENGLQEKVKVSLTDKGMHVTITDSVMFRSGEAILIEPSRTVLRLLAGVLDNTIESVVVEGHTDDRPINTSHFPSNWELSSARAATVVRYLLEVSGVQHPERFLSIGYGEHHPIDDNESAQGRSRNRRVEILFSWQPWQNDANPFLRRMPSPPSSL